MTIFLYKKIRSSLLGVPFIGINLAILFLMLGGKKFQHLHAHTKKA